MHRVFIEPALSAHELIELSEREGHHLVRVLRAREGERVEGLDGAGHRLDAIVHSISKRSVILRVEQRQIVPELTAHITLFQAIPKGKNMEWIIEKATELGARRIVPLLTDRTMMRPDASDRRQKVEKWTATAIDAIKQCGSPWLPRIEAPLSLVAALAEAGSADLSLLGTFASDTR
ncbi:MAG: RsmE family RNA methyltransferase, partial [Verrucomicrobia bacterium]|nr:RsmE family RNA methyltransferase [Verrucomicrobiota bacterium]